MIKINKHIRFIAVVFVLLLSIKLNVFAASSINNGNTAIDYGNVLSSTTENYVNSVSDALYEACGAQVGVYTVDKIGDTSIEEYSENILSDWELGKEDNGVLLVFSVEDGTSCIVRGSGLETQLNENTLNEIIESSLKPYFDTKDYDAGVINTVDQISQKLCNIYGVSIDTSDIKQTEDSSSNSYIDTSQSSGRRLEFAMLFVMLLIIAISFSLVMRGDYRRSNHIKKGGRPHNIPDGGRPRGYDRPDGYPNGNRPREHRPVNKRPFEANNHGRPNPTSQRDGVPQEMATSKRANGGPKVAGPFGDTRAHGGPKAAGPFGNSKTHGGPKNKPR